MLAGCGPDTDGIARRLEACEPHPDAVSWVWDGDRVAPCGEVWLLEHAPDGQGEGPVGPLRRAREAVRDVVRGRGLPGARSLDVRPEGLPDASWSAHVDLLVAHLPERDGDPWLSAMIGLEREDVDAAARLVAWSTWDPDPDRRLAVLERAVALHDLDPPCDLRLAGPQCHWELADRLLDPNRGGEPFTFREPTGPPGVRDRPSDALWMERGPRAAGMAGDWVAAWQAWVAAAPARGAVVRPGVAREAAGALWVGGNELGNARLRGELGLDGLDAALYDPGPATADASAGSRAAAAVPW